MCYLLLLFGDSGSILVNIRAALQWLPRMASRFNNNENKFLFPVSDSEHWIDNPFNPKFFRAVQIISPSSLNIHTKFVDAKERVAISRFLITLSLIFSVFVRLEFSYEFWNMEHYLNIYVLIVGTKFTYCNCGRYVVMLDRDCWN